MRKIQEAAPPILASLKRRTIRSLAMGDIEKTDCDFITKHIEEIDARIDKIRKDQEHDSVHGSESGGAPVGGRPGPGRRDEDPRR